VYAAADTAGAAKRGIRRALKVHLNALTSAGRPAEPHADVVVLRYDSPARTRRARECFLSAVTHLFDGPELHHTASVDPGRDLPEARAVSQETIEVCLRGRA
jgi:hypothetical protein